MAGRFERKGTYVYLWLIHIAVWKKPTQQCKAIILQLKINEKILTKQKKQTKKQQFSILASKGNQLQLIHLGSYKNADAWIQLCASSQAKC